MSNLTLVAGQWHDSINQVEKTEPILGGSSGNANLATKQLAENILWLREHMQAHKVGDIYTTTINHANAAAVAAHHGYGEWERYAEGRTLVGFSTKSSDPDDYKTMGNEFGENTHTLTIEESAKHKHSQNDILNKFTAKGSEVLNTAYNNNSSGGVTSRAGDDTNATTDEYFIANVSEIAWDEATEQERGGDQPHNNVQPSRVVGHWLRTA